MMIQQWVAAQSHEINLSTIRFSIIHLHTIYSCYLWVIEDILHIIANRYVGLF